MKLTEEALRLTKKYASGALCKVNFCAIKQTMFYPHYLLIAGEKNLDKINVDVVREYWLKIHNQIVIERFKIGILTLEEARQCMVRPRKSGKKFFAVHGNKTVDVLTLEQAEILAQEIQKAPEGLQ